jgi:hypothetical protein
MDLKKLKEEELINLCKESGIEYINKKLIKTLEKQH